jgi:hypothetical protein
MLICYCLGNFQWLFFTFQEVLMVIYLNFFHAFFAIVSLVFFFGARVYSWKWYHKWCSWSFKLRSWSRYTFYYIVFLFQMQFFLVFLVPKDLLLSLFFLVHGKFLLFLLFLVQRDLMLLFLSLVQKHLMLNVVIGP